MFVSWSKKVTAKIFPDGGFLALNSWGFNPNRLTAISAVFKILASYFFLTGNIVLGGVCIILDYFFDFLDGGVARRTGQVTRRGGIYDFVSDRILREFWIAALAYSGAISFNLAFWVIMVDMFSYFINDYAELNKLKQIEWMPANIKFIIFGVFTGFLNIFFLIGIFVNSFLTLVNVASLVILNKEDKK
ncbi:CDP-alcohol phosphatidyltransferase family protein [Patescibacteria group bacterium]|nr:CDP-alcohol phosphatidyltransferase family protein [Patescibacteria group bacterium]